MPPERRREPKHVQAISVLAVGALLVALLADGATPEAFTGTGGDDGGWTAPPSSEPHPVIERILSSTGRLREEGPRQPSRLRGRRAAHRRRQQRSNLRRGGPLRPEGSGCADREPGEGSSAVRGPRAWAWGETWGRRARPEIIMILRHHRCPEGHLREGS
jgi:hypothetical protein